MKTLPLVEARKKLLACWLLGGLFSLATLSLQTLFDRYGPLVGNVWRWLISAIMPTLSLVMAVVGADAIRHSQKKEAVVDRFFFRLTVLLSLAYLSSVAIVLWIPNPPMGLFQQAGYFTMATQSLVAGALGVFFTQPSAVGHSLADRPITQTMGPRQTIPTESGDQTPYHELPADRARDYVVGSR